MRALAAHTYNQALAEAIYAALPAYRKRLHAWLTRLELS